MGGDGDMEKTSRAIANGPDSPQRAADEAGPAHDAGAAALEGVFRAHAHDVLRAAYRVTGSLSDAEDVLQTVFLRLARHGALHEARHEEGAGTDPEPGPEPVSDRGPDRGPDLEPGPPAAAYLRRAAVNAALDVIRGRKRRPAVPLDADAGPEPADDQADPERRHAGREARAHLRRAVAELSPRAAQVFALRYFEGLGNREIARLLAMSQTAVAVTLHRTRARLRKELGAPLGGLS